MLLMLLPSAGLIAQKKVKQPPKQLSPEELAKMSKGKMRPPTGANFYIEAIGESRSQYTLLLTDADNRSVAGTFLLSQVSLFHALVVAAREFADTNESVGTVSKPETTRFKDKGEPSFTVDVQKTATHSHFYVSMSSLNGKITVDAGALKRGAKDHDDILFLKILSRLQTVVGESQTPK
ncbi:MAG TPA: hypothetical protein VNS63_16215 [Blastocatellia bacterium]|nr:hypothetical protein [Blastocatellia bacterium]